MTPKPQKIIEEFENLILRIEKTRTGHISGRQLWNVDPDEEDGYLYIDETLKSFLTQSLTQVYQSAIDDAIKCVPEEKGKTGDFNMTFSDGVISSIPIESNFDAGFNEACTQTLNNLEKLR